MAFLRLGKPSTNKRDGLTRRKNGCETADEVCYAGALAEADYNARHYMCVSDEFLHFLWNILRFPVEIHGLSVYSKG